MRSHVNSVLLEGNVVRDSNVRVSTGGSAYLQFTIASNKYVKETKSTVFMDCVAFGKVAESVNGLSKGENVVIYGELTQSSYDKNGQKITRTEIVAHSILFKDSKGGGGGNKENDVTATERFSDDSVPF